jgi:enoyl-[acyl-carrier-protein] reductase (NADH)
LTKGAGAALADTLLDRLPDIDDTRFSSAGAQPRLLRRLRAAKDVADTVVFLRSATSDLFQGQTIIVDVGASLRG